MARKIFVGNLNFKTTEPQLRRLFAETGDVISVVIPKNHDTGRSRGFAFVEFADEMQASMAVEVYNGRSLAGRELRVRLAQERHEPSPRRKRARDTGPTTEDDPLDFEFPDDQDKRRKPRYGWQQLRGTKRTL